MTYDNIKSHKKTGFHPLFRRYPLFFEKPQQGCQIDRPSRFRIKNYIMLDKICISPSMCLENDYIRLVLRDY